jgi:hypothetical protein
MLVAGAVAPSVAAVTGDDRAAMPLTPVTAPAARHAEAAPAPTTPTPTKPAPVRSQIALVPGADLHGVLRSTKLEVTGVDLYEGVVAVSGAPVSVVLANGLRLVAGGAGPLVSARHLLGHLRT